MIYAFPVFSLEILIHLCPGGYCVANTASHLLTQPSHPTLPLTLLYPVFQPTAWFVCLSTKLCLGLSSLGLADLATQRCPRASPRIKSFNIWGGGMLGCWFLCFFLEAPQRFSASWLFISLCMYYLSADLIQSQTIISSCMTCKGKL